MSSCLSLGWNTLSPGGPSFAQSRGPASHNSSEHCLPPALHAYIINTGQLKKYVDICGDKKVAWTVTDSPSTCRLARELLTKMPGCEHVMEMR